MDVIHETTADGVVRRRFDLTVEDRTVPGLHWWPAGASGPRPTVLVGHGGFQSKEAPNIVAFALQLAHERGWATVALDAPGHGERRTVHRGRENRSRGPRRRHRRGGTGQDRRHGHRDRRRSPDRGSESPHRP